MSRLDQKPDVCDYSLHCIPDIENLVNFDGYLRQVLNRFNQYVKIGDLQRAMDSRSDFVSLVNYAGQYVNHQVQNSELSGKFNIQNEAILQAMSRALQDLRSAIVQNLTGSRGIDGELLLAGQARYLSIMSILDGNTH